MKRKSSNRYFSSFTLYGLKKMLGSLLFLQNYWKLSLLKYHILDIFILLCFKLCENESNQHKKVMLKWENLFLVFKSFINNCFTPTLRLIKLYEFIPVYTLFTTVRNWCNKYFLYTRWLILQGYKIDVKYPTSKNNVQNRCKIPTKK